ncbi:MAG: VPLPA-CTERM-specific exosortase XrtD [Methylophaga sp.]|nr:VPLPA-CTERM-specific exosortase XrtD [Methylophaga sp.]
MILLAVIAYWNGLGEAVRRWGGQEEYSHGYLIPLVTAYILWEKRDVITRAMGPPMWSGLLLILAAILIYIVGEISALFLLMHYSFVMVLIGISMLVVGQATRYTLAPILLLLFAIPLPYVIEVQLTAGLQLFSSWLGVQFIRLFQIPVFLEGNIIDLGIYQLQVVDACSGLRYLFPLMSLGFIAAYFYQAAFWKRALVFLATIPITILMNSFRIGMIGVLVDNFGISMAEGFLHDFEGWIIFMACAVILGLLIWVLEKITNPNASLASVFGVVDASKLNIKEYSGPYTFSLKPALIASVVLLLALGLTRAVESRTEFVPDYPAFVNFPTQLGEWRGQHESMEQRVIDALKLSDYVMANYVSENNEMVNFYVAYYESQRKGVSPHSPRVCIPGGGWEISRLQRIEALGQPVNRVIIQRGADQQLVYYWFAGRGRNVANEYLNKWYLFRDSIFENRSDGALVRLVTGVGPGETLEDADARILDFLAVVQPELDNFIVN